MGCSPSTELTPRDYATLPATKKDPQSTTHPRQPVQTFRSVKSPAKEWKPPNLKAIDEIKEDSNDEEDEEEDQNKQPGATHNRMLSPKELKSPKSKTEKQTEKQQKRKKKKIASKFKSSIKIATASDPLREVLQGRPGQALPSSSRIIRIFTSSTFTDTKYERNALMERVYPRLKAFCQEQGFAFQVVDMRWGVREEAQNDHTTTEICLKELRACQKLSTGPNFVTFFSHKYGFCPFPREIYADLFDKITSDLTDRKLVNKWFRLDNNACPPVYVYQPISSQYPDYLSDDAQKRKEASKAWWRDFQDLQEMLIDGATRNVGDENVVRQLKISVTERELEAGLLSVKDTSQTCLWFKRNFVDIEQQECTKSLSRYYECSDSSAHSLEEVHQHVKKLRNHTLTRAIPESNIVEYNIHWQEGGINSKQSEEHRAYIDQLCADFEARMSAMIVSSINAEKARDIQDPVFREVIQHALFRDAKCQKFHGRHDSVKSIEDYIKGKSTDPLVLYGASGCGKTSLMAIAAKDAWDWRDGKAAVVYRFIGTSHDSSSVRPLLSSINSQIMRVYAPDTERYYTGSELKPLSDEFLMYLSAIPTEKPLVLLLDSLDQLDTVDGGKQLDWLPKQLPQNVKLVLSTLPDVKYGTYPRCKALYPEDCFLRVPALQVDDVKGILLKWLAASDRTLSEGQMEYLTAATRKQPLPLYVKLSFDEAVRWHSYDSPESTQLESSIIASINALFSKLEKSHGHLMVKHALTYLTISPGGLSEGEMEDLLSLCDDVLNDVYQFWTPPVRRLPPLLWVRAKNDLEEYIVKRGVDGTQVIYWYHRQFIETAQSRYLSDEAFVVDSHNFIADYFSGKWADVPKPYMSKKTKKEETALRYVNPQPLQYKGETNLRRLSQLPYHLVKAGEREQLMDLVVCNYHFLHTKLRAVGLRGVLQDLKLAQMAFPKDRDISVVLETLQLSQDALSRHPDELAGQLLGRIHSYGGDTVSMVTQAKQLLEMEDVDKETRDMVGGLVAGLEILMEKMDKQNQRLNKLLLEARQSLVTVLVPHDGFMAPPGGQLFHKLAGHFEKINDMAMTENGKLLVTGSDDKSVKFWNIYTGEILNSLDLSAEVKFVKVIPGGNQAVVSCNLGNMYVIDTAQNSVICELETSHSEYSARPISVCRCNGKPTIVALRNQYVDLFDAETGKCVMSFNDDLKVHKTQIWGEQKHLASTADYVVYAAYADNDIYIVPVKDLKAMKVHKVNLFPDEAEWLNLDTIDHISAMEIAGDIVVLCNGKTQELLFISLQTRKLVRTVPKHKGLTISQISFSQKDNLLYYCTERDIGSLNLKSQEKKLSFHHPCKITKVLSYDGRMVVTIGEDNILRIWDQIMEPFSPDLSMFTGKVTVHSEHSRNMLQQMTQGITGTDIDIKDVLTASDAKNYWSIKGAAQSHGDIVTLFHPMESARYIMAVQSVHSKSVSMKWSQCLTVWDLDTMQCKRRLFLPDAKEGALGTVYVHTVLDNDKALLQENGIDIEYKLLDLKTWKMEKLVSVTTVKKLWNSKVLHLKYRDAVVCEVSFEHLAIYDLAALKETGLLRVPENTVKWHLKQLKIPTPYRTHQAEVHKFDTLQSTSDQNTVIAQWGGWIVLVYDLSSFSLIHEIRIKDMFKWLSPQTHPISLSPVCDDTWMVVTADREDNKGDEAAVIDIVQGSSSGLLSVLKGKKTGEVNRDALNPQILASINGAVAMLRMYPEQERKLQLVATLNSGKGVMLDEQAVGLHANHCVLSPSLTHCVTWATDPVDKTIYFWGIAGGKLELQGTFTPDAEVTDVALLEGSNSLLISNASGLVRLELAGQSVTNEEPKPASLPEEYSGVELETTKLIYGGDSSVRGDSGGRGCKVRADSTYTIPEHKACKN